MKPFKDKLDLPYEEFAEEMTKDIVDDDPNYGIPGNIEQINAVIEQHESQFQNSNPQVQTLVDNPSVILLNENSSKYKTGLYLIKSSKSVTNRSSTMRIDRPGRFTTDHE